MHPTSFFSKNIDRFFYLIFLILIFIGNLTLKLIGIILPFFISKDRKGVVFFPYAFKGSDGEYRRILQYLPYFDEDKIPYSVKSITSDTIALKYYNGIRWKLYFFLIYVFYKRIFQITSVIKYDAVFIQRGLFPMYFDLKFPQLEKTVYKLNKNVVIDYWDSVFENQPDLTKETVKFAKTITVSNSFLFDNFTKLTTNVTQWNLSIVTSSYKVKTDFSLHHPIRLVWTGMPHNLANLKYIYPTLIQVNKVHPLVLVIIGKEAPVVDSLTIEHHLWNASTFHSLLQGADIGIYPEKNTIHANGKSAMKVMDFLTTGLAMIGVPYGIPKEVSHLNQLYLADNNEAWENGLLTLINDENLRKSLGTNARKTIIEHYDVLSNYNQFKKILFSKK
jgi:glycosyltransferase involved in cell wall biosynthesis